MFFRPPSNFEAAPGIDGFRSVLVNYFIVASPVWADDWFLIDAGIRSSGVRILAAAKQRFGGRPPRAVFLTHAHFDHVGALATLMERWHVPVYAHEYELPFLNHGLEFPRPDPSVGGGALALSSFMFPRRVPALPRAVEPLPADGSLPELPGWRVIATPGHTPGHVSFWREQDRVLLSGDAVVTTRQESLLAVWSQRPEVRPPPAYFTPDWQRAYQSVARIRQLRPRVLVGGHGLPLSGERLQRGLDCLTDDFEQRGLPRHGHYVDETWSRAKTT